MVASHNIGIAVRSFVKIPGSGSCSAAGTVYKDFSRVCEAAAIVAAQQRPPQVMMQAQHRRFSSSMDAAFIRKIAANMRTSALPARDRSPEGGQRKRLRSHPSEGNGEADAPPQAKAPKTIRIVVGGTGAVSPAPDRVAARLVAARQVARLVAARRVARLVAARRRRLMNHRNRLLQENQALLQREGAGLSA
uniref:Uncharacterized protein n=1 Tax=Penaeus monodon majanivirus B TaxID=2984272 RepID=A0A9C7F002_9VIRU|nr:MAG: hypothetical protein [Penaeus monodon majanivirus B]